MKKCKTCSLELPATNLHFYSSKSTIDGLKGSCKECEKISSKERYNKNIEHRRKKSLDRYHALPEEEKKKPKNYCLEKRRSTQRIYYANNAEKVLRAKREWRKNNKIKFNEIRRRREQNRRARQIGLASDFTQKEWESCKLYFNNACAYCGKIRDLEQEHFIPVKSGGGYSASNIIPSCRSCNAKKNDKAFIEWYKNFEFYDFDREQKILSYLKQFNLNHNQASS